MPVKRRGRTTGFCYGNFRTAALVVASALAVSCRRTPSPEPVADAAAPLPMSAPTAARPNDPAPVYDFVANLARCDVTHRGALIDLGSKATGGVDGTWSFAPEEVTPSVERDGATWESVTSRALSYRFVQEIPGPVFVSLRAKARAARKVSVTIDGQPVGVLALDRKQARITSTRSSGFAISPGEHTIALRFVGSSRGSEPLAEVDWIRIAPVVEDQLTTGSYAPPTLRELSYSVTLDGIPHRAIALRAPSAVRCTTAIAEGARLRGVIGFAGAGEGSAEIRGLRDGKEPVSLGRFQVKGGDQAKWTPLDVSLEGVTGDITAIELSALSGAPGGRLVFGDPVIVMPQEAEQPMPQAKLVVVFVLSSIDAARFPPLAAAGSLPVLEELRSRSTAFLRHRSPTTVTSGVMASLLTGMSPRRHGVEDTGARLPDRLTTIAEAARDGSVQTAMFTGSPTTFAPFGFDQGWDRFAAFSPVSGTSATAPITEAAAWVSRHMKDPKARGLVVIHARGGHPPWDVTGSEASDLAPVDYSGSMEPRRSAQVIARARAKKSRYRLSEADRIRMWALYEKGLAGQDRALGALVETLRKDDLWKDTLFVVTSDTGVSNRAPFGEGEDLSEESLSVPLWVRFPAGDKKGLTVDTPTAVTDVSRTVLAALGLGIPKHFEGADLYATATAQAFASARPLGATLGSRYSVRWGDFLLHGTAGKSPVLCDLSQDPSCENSRLDPMPIVSRAMFRWMWDADFAARQARSEPREPATVDADTAAALSVWGL